MPIFGLRGNCAHKQSAGFSAPSGFAPFCQPRLFFMSGVLPKEQKKSILERHDDFYFVRHGQTPWGPDLILDGPQDLELNQLGTQQAEEAGQKLKKLFAGHETPSMKLITSPLLRALQTAQKISEITDLPIFGQEDDLKERYYGDARLLVGDAEEKKKGGGDSSGCGSLTLPPDAESPEKFKERVMKKALDKILANVPVIVVSHQKVFQCLCEELTGEASQLSQGGVAHFTTTDGKIWKVEIL